MHTPLPTTVDAYIRSINAKDHAAFVDLFADDAQVADNGREFRGREAIRDWSAQEIFQVNVTLEATAAVERGSTQRVRTKVDGDFDRTGLPDPLLIDQELEVVDGKICRLICRMANDEPL